MANPAQVITVYLGGCCKTDRFVELDPTQFKIAILEFKEILDYSRPFHKSILAPLAFITLDRLKEEFELEKFDPFKGTERIKINWHYFWERNEDTWFWEYGSLGYPNEKKGNHVVNFLENEIRRGVLIYCIDDKDYSDLIENQISASVNFTAQFLYSAKTRLMNLASSVENI